MSECGNAEDQVGEATAFGYGALLVAHACLGGMRDFVRGVPDNNGGSPHSVHASGMMNRTFAAGALRFVRRTAQRLSDDAGIDTRQWPFVGNGLGPRSRDTKTGPG
jgi:hypothetical protein